MYNFITVITIMSAATCVRLLTRSFSLRLSALIRIEENLYTIYHFVHVYIKDKEVNGQ